jgi:ParB/RepB/Spo0J family partition protein
MPQRLEVLVQELVPIDSVHPNEYNPNRQSDHEFELLLASIRADGFTTPVVVTADNTIVDGFHRWKAAQELGMTEVPVVRVDMDAAQARVSTLRHNRARGEEDIELATAILRDLDSLGMLDHAQEELLLDSVDLERLLGDVAIPEEIPGPKPMTPEEIEARREKERELREKRAKERAEQRSGEYAKMLRLDLVFADDEAELVGGILRDQPVSRLVEILSAWKERYGTA